ncbi:MAG TPA: X-Pro aminopeptidase [Holosporales bacterium]|nr:X-Pro aminopeptidase [Holosporales bacterium]
MTQPASLQEKSSLSKAALLDACRQSLRTEGFAAFILPKTDAHRSEYCAERDNLVQYLTDFSGSAGFAALKVNTPDAAIFVDGRYTLQAEQEVDSTFFSYENYTVDCIEKWISQGLKKGDKIAYDPLLLSKGEYDRFAAAFKKQSLLLEPLSSNPLHTLWQDRLPLETPNVIPHSTEYAGVSFEQKLVIIRDLMSAKKVDGFFLNYSESIAWLFNIRAPKRLVTPAASLYAYVPVTGPCSLFVHPCQNTPNLKAYFKGHVDLEDYDQTFKTIAKKTAKKIVALDKSNGTMKMLEAIEQKGGKALIIDDFCNIPRACKNETERQGTRNAHVRDGAAVSNLLAWLEQAIHHETLTELDIVEKLYQYRQSQDLFQGYSFDTISGSGPNGAIVHYRVDEKSNRTLQPDDIFLLDSGGQYLDGTTDITRTLSLNKKPSAEQKDRYTRVLKGHIALAKVRFPEGTVGSQLDPIARYHLWQIGCDYAHGTGHGVGSYLGVHEGPQRISPLPNTVPLLSGMILSNEPGYYKQGEYGIRIENLVLVNRVAKENYTDEDQNMLCFETITLAPLDTSLMDQSLLTADEISWVNSYHQRVYKALKDQVEAETLPWLKEATVSL